MTPTEYAFACLLVLVIFGWLTSNDKVRQQRDFHIIRADRAEAGAARAEAEYAKQQEFSSVLFACLEEETAERLATEADLIEAGREAATHANHLEAVLEATSEKPLSLVKGGRHG